MIAGNAASLRSGAAAAARARLAATAAVARRETVATRVAFRAASGRHSASSGIIV